jgi:hypothetical protein
VNGASGAAECRVNGVVVASVSGVNLGTTDIGGVRWGQIANGIHGTGDWFIDDVRLGDALNGVQDDFVGDRRVLLRQADRDGPIQDFTPDTGSTAWDRVDEVPPDDDASYIDGTTVGDRAQIGFEALPAGVVQVDSIAYVAYCRKTDVGDATIRLNCVSGVASPQAEELGAEYPLNITYNYLPIQIFDEDPDAAGPWTVSGADAAMCEIERTA